MMQGVLNFSRSHQITAWQLLDQLERHLKGDMATTTTIDGLISSMMARADQLFPQERDDASWLRRTSTLNSPQDSKLDSGTDVTKPLERSLMGEVMCRKHLLER